MLALGLLGALTGVVLRLGNDGIGVKNVYKAEFTVIRTTSIVRFGKL